MSYFEIRTWAWNQDLDDPAAKIVLLSLAQYADNAGYCFPSYRRISQMTGLSLSGVRAQIGKLRERGLLEVARRSRDNGGQTSNLYRLLAGHVLDDGDGHVLLSSEPPHKAANAHPGPPPPVTSKHPPLSPGDTPPVTSKHPPLSPGDTQEHRRKNREEERTAAPDGADAVVADEPRPDQSEDTVEDQEAFIEIAEIDQEAEAEIAERKRQRDYNKRAQELAKEYTRRVPLSKFPQIMTIVKRAMGAGYDDDRIRTALRQLADDGRTVTVDSLRIAMDILPAPRPARPCPCCTGATTGNANDLCAHCSEMWFRRLPCDHGASGHADCEHAR